MKRVLKWTGIAVLALVGLAGLSWLIALAVNARDEPLSAQARALLAPPPNPYPPEQNLYVAFAGFDAPAGAAVSAAGQAKIEYYQAHLDAALRLPLERGSLAVVQGEDHPLRFRGAVDFVQPTSGSVWGEVLEHGPEIGRLLDENRELYERYLALHARHGYYESARPSVLLPLYMVPSSVRRLFLAVQALRLHAGGPEAQAALAALEADVSFWRTVLTGEGTLISKMVAIAGLQGDDLLLADFVADPASELPPGAAAAALIAVFDLKDWDIGRTFASEFRLKSTIFTDVDANWGKAQVSPLHPLNHWLAGRFFKLNATYNLLARQTLRQMAAAADPLIFQDTRSDPGVWSPEDSSVWLFPFGYNPVGKTLVAIAMPGDDAYVLRAWDGAALQRLARLGLEIRRQRLAAAAIPAFLSEHPEWSSHPADGHPFKWDAARMELHVGPLARQQPDRRFFIHVWPATPAQLAPPSAPR